jgi:hypothetical protein
MVHRGSSFFPRRREIKNFGQYYSTPRSFFPLFPEKKQKKSFAENARRRAKILRAGARTLTKTVLSSIIE